MKTLVNWFIAAIVILIAAYLVPGITVASFWVALIAALVLGMINAFIKPIIIFLTLPINLVTLGLFTLVINALLIMLSASLIAGFAVASFWVALIFAIVLSVINWAVERIF
ncbi:MAG: phage holin family protein [Candidatus Paceibacterota bacterium]|jgi:putative membrane protein